MYEIWNRLQYMLSPQFDIYEQVARHVNGKVIDIGCGTGFGTHLFTRGAQEVHGIEMDENALKFAQRVFSNGNLVFHQNDITQMFVPQIESNRYDFVIMIDVIEHIDNDLLAIKNCKKLLKPSGTFICSTPNSLCRYRKSENHIREYEPSQYKKLLKEVFDYVSICDYRLHHTTSNYVNPMVGVCKIN